MKHEISCVVKGRSSHAETLRDIERPCGVQRGHHRTWYGKTWVVWLERSFQRYAFQRFTQSSELYQRANMVTGVRQQETYGETRF